MGAVQNTDGSWRFYLSCDAESMDWMPCFQEEESSNGKHRRRALDRRHWDQGTVPQRLEELTQELFRLHDLDGDGALAEQELVRLNEMIAQLHSGKDVDTSEVAARYREVFRSQLDPEGRPVAYEAFRKYARQVLEGLDADPEAQEMIMEQFIAEAQSAREVFQLRANSDSFHLASHLSGLGATQRGSNFARRGGGVPAQSFSLQSNPSFAASGGMKSPSYASVDPSVGCFQFPCPAPWQAFGTPINARSAAWKPGSVIRQPSMTFSFSRPNGANATPQVLVAPLPGHRP